MCYVHPAMHCFTCCDKSSSFIRRERVTPVSVLQKYYDFIEVFKCLGNDNKRHHLVKI